MSDNYGCFCTLASVTGSLYVQMRIQNHLPEDEVWFCILKMLPWGIFERWFPLEYDWAFKRHVRPLLSKHRKTALNKPVSVDEAPEKLPRFTEGLPTLLETWSLRNVLNSLGYGLVEITAKSLNVVDSKVPYAISNSFSSVLESQMCCSGYFSESRIAILAICICEMILVPVLSARMRSAPLKR